MYINLKKKKKKISLTFGNLDTTPNIKIDFRPNCIKCPNSLIKEFMPYLKTPGMLEICSMALSSSLTKKGEIYITKQQYMYK